MSRPLFGKAHGAAGEAQAAQDTDVTMCHHGGRVALQLAHGPLKGPFSSLIVGDKGTLLQGSLGVGRQLPAVPDWAATFVCKRTRVTETADKGGYCV